MLASSTSSFRLSSSMSRGGAEEKEPRGRREGGERGGGTVMVGLSFGLREG